MNTMTCFDIETGPLPDADLAALEPEFSAPANWVDQTKIDAHKAKEREKWRDQAALDPTTGRILAIGYMSENAITIDDATTEADRINVFFNLYRDAASSGGRMVGFSITRFDLPYIVKRAWILGVPVPPALRPNGQSRFYWPHTFIDLQQIWGLGELHPAGSLDFILKRLGFEGKIGSGKDFARLYLDPATRKDALAYLSQELSQLSKLAERFLE